MSRKQKKIGLPIHGWLVLDKPEEVTSTQAVARCLRLFNAQKAGHGGTLDPLASGILPIAFGEATKTVGYVMEADKDYVFTVRWGSSTTTQRRCGAGLFLGRAIRRTARLSGPQHCAQGHGAGVIRSVSQNAG
jgi:tRNA pseudouridine55 synthase